MYEDNMAKYIIYADEAWTHSSQPLNRYHNFFGGIFGEEKYLDRLTHDLQKIRAKHNCPNIEIKWSNLDQKNIDMYREMVECLATHIQSGRIRYRQMFKDRSFHYVGTAKGSELDIQFKQYYQFLKHAFGFKYLSIPPANTKHQIVLRLDTHSSQQHKNELSKLINDLPNIIERDDISLTVSYINSSSNLCLQVCDVLMGAAGYHGNQMKKRKVNGRKQITQKQKLKDEMCKFIYKILGDIHNQDRQKKAFQWFESTGTDGDVKNRLKHKLRIWKFIAFPYQKNKGWEKDHLDKQGLFIQDDFDPQIIYSHTGNLD